LKDASYLGAKRLGRGQDYQYAHNYEDHFVQQVYMPQKARYYVPTDMGYEKIIRDHLNRLYSKQPAETREKVAASK
jgi:putative ATPase